ncbi:unnamed protein product [Dovyalis caffra]|uniref:Thioesterase domain-containing protein n=1 Tax=Dovyalis caffra TaxID=77055 RepID=A0AAV1SAY2_9ROSI|nr:unnamed protein product [Dovyalis caffra]
MDKLHHGLCYESLQLKDLNIYLEAGSFPSTDCYIRTAGSPCSFSTPISHNRMSCNCSSPESRLRSKARSFKGTPSIIRKRSSKTLRQAGDATYSDRILALEADNGFRSLGSCSSDKDDGVDLLNKKQLFLSPPKSQKLETSEDMKSIEKRLEYAFNVEGSEAGPKVWSMNPKLGASLPGRLVKGFLADVGIHASLPQNSFSKDFYSDIFRDLLKADNVQRRLVSCIVPVLPVIGNYFGSLHGGAVGAIAERVSVACARTVVADDKKLFLGELSISYLSAAKLNEVLMVEASVVRSGRNLTVVASEFRIKKTRKLVYTSRATFYHMPAANGSKLKVKRIFHAEG